MPALRKYDQETRDRMVRMYQERRRDFPKESGLEARKRVGELLDVKPDTLRGWIERVEIDAGERPGVPSAVNARIKELERENAELRRPMRSSRRRRRFSLRRSSTANCGDHRLHRPVPGPLRSRADLPAAHRARRADRSEHLLRPQGDPGQPGRLGRRPHGQHRLGGVAGQPEPLRGGQVGHGHAKGRPRGRPGHQTSSGGGGGFRPGRTSGGWPTSPTWTLEALVYTSFVSDVWSRRILGRWVSSSKATPLVVSALEQALFTAGGRTPASPLAA